MREIEKKILLKKDIATIKEHNLSFEISEEREEQTQTDKKVCFALSPLKRCFEKEEVKEIEGKLENITKASICLDCILAQEFILKDKGVTEKEIVGTVINVQSTTSLCNSYRYGKKYVSYKFKRRTTGWYFCGCHREVQYPNSDIAQAIVSINEATKIRLQNFALRNYSIKE